MNHAAHGTPECRPTPVHTQPTNDPRFPLPTLAPLLGEGERVWDRWGSTHDTTEETTR